MGKLKADVEIFLMSFSSLKVCSLVKALLWRQYVAEYNKNEYEEQITQSARENIFILTKMDYFSVLICVYVHICA